jgi:DNA-binding CsgD family transcriptional regulator
MAVGVTSERQVAALVDSCGTVDDGEELFAEVSQRLNEIVPFDGAAWFATDPATVLATCPARIENVESGHCESYWERECQVEDAMLFRDLARATSPAATLFESTHGQPARSARYREFLAPQGYGDELRAAFRLGESTWGVVDLLREQARDPFSARDLEMVRTIAPAVGSALRSFTAVERGTAQVAGGDGPGTALFDPNGMLTSLDDQAERWFSELAGPGWANLPLPMTAVHAVVARAPAVAAGRDRGPAAVRLRTTAGRWLAVHASCLRLPGGGAGPIALSIEPAKSAQIAPIIVEAYCLTAREQEITRSVARGLSNAEIATELYLSAHTVRDHLKAIFGKVGVGSRGELVAKLFADHYAPAMHVPGAPVQHVDR